MNLYKDLKHLMVANSKDPGHWSPIITVTGLPLSGKSFVVKALQAWFTSQHQVPANVIGVCTHAQTRRDLTLNLENILRFSADWLKQADAFFAGIQRQQCLFIVEDWWITPVIYALSQGSTLRDSDLTWYSNRAMVEPGLWILLRSGKENGVKVRANSLNENLHATIRMWLDSQEIEILKNYEKTTERSVMLQERFWSSPQDLYPEFDRLLVPWLNELNKKVSMHTKSLN